MTFEQVKEEFNVRGAHLVEKVKELIHEGNVQRIIIKNEQAYPAGNSRHPGCDWRDRRTGAGRGECKLRVLLPNAP